MSMSEALSTDPRTRVTVADLYRFSGAVEIHDARAFADALQAFIHERLAKSKHESNPRRDTSTQKMADRAATRRADARWAPGETEIQRGRTVLLEAFDRSHNLPLPEYARLANKSRQQIYKDIEARRLLALNVGPRGRKLPDWQLDPIGQRLTQAVLLQADQIDNWTLYRALSDPLEGLGWQSPVDAVTRESIEDVANAVFNVLGIQ